MIQVGMTVTIGDGRVQKVEWSRDMAQYATPQDKLEANSLIFVMDQRVKRFARRGGRSTP